MGTKTDDRIELHKLATAQIVALGYGGRVTLGTKSEDSYLDFYERIFNKLEELTEAD